LSQHSTDRGQRGTSYDTLTSPKYPPSKEPNSSVVLDEKTPTR
jgi:hypothetical protein